MSSINPIRIRTVIGSTKVYTLYSLDKWITVITNPEFGITSCEANSLLEAGANHLQVCQNCVNLD
jgi:hypothetical protein